MENNKQVLLTSVSSTLTDLYAQYSSEGILALYIWGSILTPDFNPETSDIDTIAIVEDTLDAAFEEKIQQQLALKHPEIKKLGFRLLYKSELDTGTVKGMLGRVGVPAILLLDLPTWYWVCGTSFSQKDFDLPVPTIEEAVKMRKDSCIERWPNIESVQPDAVQYFVKQIMRIVHLVQLRKTRAPYRPFSYTALKRDTEGMPEQGIVEICLHIKTSGWDFNEFKKHQKRLFLYIDSVIPFE